MRALPLLLLVVWLMAAVILGAQGVMATLRPPIPQVVVASLVAALLIIYGIWKDFREWILALPIERLVAVHAVRFVGIYFLVLHAQGRLPFAFAVPGGIGDILIAVSATVLIFVRAARKKAVLAIWNLLGLMDIFMVVGTAAHQGLTHPGSMNALGHLPLSLLPTFFVPLIIFTHFVIARRLLGKRAGPPQT